jgi:hypothetical protein
MVELQASTAFTTTRWCGAPFLWCACACAVCSVVASCLACLAIACLHVHKQVFTVPCCIFTCTHTTLRRVILPAISWPQCFLPSLLPLPVPPQQGWSHPPSHSAHVPHYTVFAHAETLNCIYTLQNTSMPLLFALRSNAPVGLPLNHARFQIVDARTWPLHWAHSNHLAHLALFRVAAVVSQTLLAPCDGVGNACAHARLRGGCTPRSARPWPQHGCAGQQHTSEAAAGAGQAGRGCVRLRSAGLQPAAAGRPPVATFASFI